MKGMKKAKDAAPTKDRSKSFEKAYSGKKKPALKTTDSKPVAPRAKTFC